MREHINGATDDGRLLSSAAAGDEEAFAELVERHRNFVYRVCRRICCDGTEAEDVTQQVFLILSEKAGELTDRTSIAGWLYRTAWQVSARSRRSATARQSHERAAAKSEGAAVVTQEPDVVAKLHNVVAQLPEAYQQAIVLHYFKGYTVAEAALQMRCPSGTMASRISRGLQMIRRKLTDRGLMLTALGVKLLLLEEMRRAGAVVPKGGPPAAPIKIIRVAGGIRNVPSSRGFVAAPVMALMAAAGAALSATIVFGRSSYQGASSMDWRRLIAAVPAAATLNGLPKGAKIAAAAVLALALSTTGFAAYKLAPGLKDGAAAAADLILRPGNGADKSGDQKTTNGDAHPHQTVYYGGGASAVPEPSSILVLAALSPLALKRRRLTK